MKSYETLLLLQLSLKGFHIIPGVLKERCMEWNQTSAEVKQTLCIEEGGREGEKLTARGLWFDYYISN